MSAAPPHIKLRREGAVDGRTLFQKRNLCALLGATVCQLQSHSPHQRFAFEDNPSLWNIVQQHAMIGSGSGGQGWSRRRRELAHLYSTSMSFQCKRSLSMSEWDGRTLLRVEIMGHRFVATRDLRQGLRAPNATSIWRCLSMSRDTKIFSLFSVYDSVLNSNYIPECQTRDCKDSDTDRLIGESDDGKRATCLCGEPAGDRVMEHKKAALFGANNQTRCALPYESETVRSGDESVLIREVGV